MTSIQTPLAIQAIHALNSEKDALETHLDSLLQQYLNLLDAYTTARESLNKELASGYLSLAEANFKAPRGVRYGSDLYDERMKASSRIAITSPTSFSPSSSCSSLPTSSNTNTNTNPNPPPDPIKQFSPLPTPSLRASQHSFHSAVSSAAKTVSLSEEMKVLEIEVRRTRKKLGKLG